MASIDRGSGGENTLCPEIGHHLTRVPFIGRELVTPPPLSGMFPMAANWEMVRGRQWHVQQWDSKNTPRTYL